MSDKFEILPAFYYENFINFNLVLLENCILPKSPTTTSSWWAGGKRLQSNWQKRLKKMSHKCLPYIWNFSQMGSNSVTQMSNTVLNRHVVNIVIRWWTTYMTATLEKLHQWVISPFLFLSTIIITTFFFRIRPVLRWATTNI